MNNLEEPRGHCSKTKSTDSNEAHHFPIANKPQEFRPHTKALQKRVFSSYTKRSQRSRAVSSELLAERRVKSAIGVADGIAARGQRNAFIGNLRDINSRVRQKQEAVEALHISIYKPEDRRGSIVGTARGARVAFQKARA